MSSVDGRSIGSCAYLGHQRDLWQSELASSDQVIMMSQHERDLVLVVMQSTRKALARMVRCPSRRLRKRRVSPSTGALTSVGATYRVPADGGARLEGLEDPTPGRSFEGAPVDYPITGATNGELWQGVGWNRAW